MKNRYMYGYVIVAILITILKTKYVINVKREGKRRRSSPMISIKCEICKRRLAHSIDSKVVDGNWYCKKHLNKEVFPDDER